MASASKPISGLPQVHSYITTHDANKKAVVHSTRPASWDTFDENRMAFNLIYTTSEFPVDLNDEKDIAAHQKAGASQGRSGLTNPNGTVLRMVDFAPGYQCLMHRTESLDYAIVLEGNVLMVLDSGETKELGRGDVVVQRATMHAWKNSSDTEWARMIFALQNCPPVTVDGEVLGEDMGHGLAGLAGK